MAKPVPEWLMSHLNLAYERKYIHTPFQTKVYNTFKYILRDREPEKKRSLQELITLCGNSGQRFNRHMKAAAQTMPISIALNSALFPIIQYCRGAQPTLECAGGGALIGAGWGLCALMVAYTLNFGRKDLSDHVLETAKDYAPELLKNFS